MSTAVSHQLPPSSSSTTTLPTSSTTSTSSSKPTFSPAEIKHREACLLGCFQLINVSNTGYITTSELEHIARMFNPNGNDFSQESKIIFNKLDRNHDNLIDKNEWVDGLFDLFRFMTDAAFNKHIDELYHYAQRK